MYYNTTNQSGSVLAELNIKAMTQDDYLICFFQKIPYRERYFTPFEVLTLSGLPKNTPITSVRRSLNALTKKGLLIKSDIKRKGMLGRDNYCWTLND